MRELTVVPVPGPGAEDVLIGYDGTAYTGTADGSIPGGQLGRRRSVGSGTPVGDHWVWSGCPEGRILVCDAHRGCSRCVLDTGAVEVPADSVDGRRYATATTPRSQRTGRSGSLTPVPSGASRWEVRPHRDTRTGRLLRLRGPGESEPEVVLRGLCRQRRCRRGGFLLRGGRRDRDQGAQTCLAPGVPHEGERDLFAGDLPRIQTTSRAARTA